MENEEREGALIRGGGEEVGMGGGGQELPSLLGQAAGSSLLL